MKPLKLYATPRLLSRLCIEASERHTRSMWQGRTVLILVAGIAGLGALLAFCSHPREPRYQNRPLGYWVALLAGPRA